ncbi:MAG: integration host factor subunit beta [Deltaproteobacteria bacterium]|nr:integration host factor subunit beta [Deltaproteobacteria bacterium]MBW2308838.1 integration host factor subunit beta [Deltaproteobacteria bacterium]
MNKSELIAVFSEHMGYTQRKAELVVNTIFDSMADALVNSDRIEIRGFGSFVVKHYQPYTGRNPKTGDKIAVNSKKLPFFKVGKDLKNRINSG